MNLTIFIRLAGLQLAVTVFLVIVPSISATPSRTVIRQGGLPPGWSSIGCYKDSHAHPALTARWYTDPYQTVKSCVNSCNDQNFIYAGLDRATDCHCGNVLTPGTNSTSASHCSLPCAGNPDESCGGTESLDLYQSGGTSPSQPIPVKNVGRWHYLGCFGDSNNARTLKFHVPVRGGPYNNTVENCITACRDATYTMAGVEFASQCWCDNAIENGGMITDPGNCLLACTGDSSELCGGAHCYNLYTNVEMDAV